MGSLVKHRAPGKAPPAGPSGDGFGGLESQSWDPDFAAIGLSLNPAECAVARATRAQHTYPHCSGIPSVFFFFKGLLVSDKR